jgi:hypothetical protein
MQSILIPHGECLSRPLGEFIFSPLGYLLAQVDTVEQTRRNRLQMLVKEYKGLANLCEALGYSRKETSGLSRIVNGNLRHERDDAPYHVGSPMARRIEQKLDKPLGWMDTPPTYAELDPHPLISELLKSALVLRDRDHSHDLNRLVSIARTLVESPPPPQPVTAPEPVTTPATPIMDLYKKRNTTPPQVFDVQAVNAKAKKPPKASS